ncbi:MAG TPA: ankyrin repeat domain-containing protein [Bryobacteraceae bacterium]|jgi:ankyrin repeat protein
MHLLLWLVCSLTLAADPTSGDGSTPLHWASYHDDLQAANRLIHAGADVNAATDLGVTPLWAASQNGSEAMVKKLLDAGANPNLALLSGETPLMVAARGGYTGVVELLLVKGANPNAHGTRSQTALMWAVAQKHPDVVKVLLAHGADVRARSDVWSMMMAVPPHGYLGYNQQIPHGGDTALMFAARVGDLESAKLLVAAGANVNDADAWSVSATVLAAHSGFRDLVLYFLDKGADANAARAGFSALHEAIMRRDEKEVAALLEHGADANAPLKTWTPTRRSSKDFHFEPVLVGATPFWLAAHFDEPGIMRLLVAHGANALFVHHSDEVADRGFKHKTETTTALMAAVGMGGGSAWVQAERGEREALTLDAVKIAVDLGVDVNARNNEGSTALDGAQALRYETVIQYLVSKGAKANRPVVKKAAPVEN